MFIILFQESSESFPVTLLYSLQLKNIYWGTQPDTLLYVIVTVPGLVSVVFNKRIFAQH